MSNKKKMTYCLLLPEGMRGRGKERGWVEEREERERERRKEETCCREKRKEWRDTWPTFFGDSFAFQTTPSSHCTMAPCGTLPTRLKGRQE